MPNLFHTLGQDRELKKLSICLTMKLNTLIILPRNKKNTMPPKTDT